MKVHILTKCKHCEGQAHLPAGETEDYMGEKYTRYQPCPMCEGTGNQSTWIGLVELSVLLQVIECPHEHTSMNGGYHYNGQEMWDDLVEVCDGRLSVHEPEFRLRFLPG